MSPIKGLIMLDIYMGTPELYWYLQSVTSWAGFPALCDQELLDDIITLFS